MYAACWAGVMCGGAALGPPGRAPGARADCDTPRGYGPRLGSYPYGKPLAAPPDVGADPWLVERACPAPAAMPRARAMGDGPHDIGVAAPPGVDAPALDDACVNTSDTSIDTGSFGSPSDATECTGLVSMNAGGCV